MFYIPEFLVWAGAFSKLDLMLHHPGNFYEKHMQTHDFGVFVMGV